MNIETKRTYAASNGIKAFPQNSGFHSRFSMVANIFCCCYCSLSQIPFAFDLMLKIDQYMWPSPETAEMFSCGAYGGGGGVYTRVLHTNVCPLAYEICLRLVWDLCERIYKQQCTLFNLTEFFFFMSEVKTL